jgi:hypothetical protein
MKKDGFRFNFSTLRTCVNNKMFGPLARIYGIPANTSATAEPFLAQLREPTATQILLVGVAAAVSVLLRSPNQIILMSWLNDLDKAGAVRLAGNWMSLGRRQTETLSSASANCE